MIIPRLIKTPGVYRVRISEPGYQDGIFRAGQI